MGQKEGRGGELTINNLNLNATNCLLFDKVMEPSRQKKVRTHKSKGLGRQFKTTGKRMTKGNTCFLYLKFPPLNFGVWGNFYWILVFWRFRILLDTKVEIFSDWYLPLLQYCELTLFDFGCNVGEVLEFTMPQLSLFSRFLTFQYLGKYCHRTEIQYWLFRRRGPIPQKISFCKVSFCVLRVCRLGL